MLDGLPTMENLSLSAPNGSSEINFKIFNTLSKLEVRKELVF